MLLTGRTALVTGGAIRVGRALTVGLAAAGARVVIHHHSSAAEAEALAEEIRAGGGEAATIQADLSVHTEVLRLADEAARPFGTVDVLVNNASIFPEAALAEVDEALWESTLAINLKAPFFLTQRLGGAMKARGAGVIVNLGDLAGIQTWKGYAAHAVSKAGLLHFTRVAARALAPEVRVNAIAPGTVLPPEDFPEEEVRALARRAPLARNGSPRDVVEAALYLIAADFVTGETILLDGGRRLV
jgi:NAD(P)-dependent dehydrogenase (short-subunit alcohol dehydrogenase family)